MNFEYEISAEEFAGGQALWNKSISGRKRLAYAVVFIVMGLLFISAAWNEPLYFSWAHLLLVAIGGYCICCGAAILFPKFHFRRSYAKSTVIGKRFRAEVNEEGFEVTGEDCTWRVPWSGVSAKAEDQRVFMFYAAGTIFMFGKKYLTDDQQRDLRRLAALQTRG